MTRIGRRDQLIAIERATAVQDRYGEETKTWAQIGQEWAAVYYGRGSERRQAAMEQGALVANFTILSNPITEGIRPTDRMVHAGSAWDIEGISPETPRPGEIEITATRSMS